MESMTTPLRTWRPMAMWTAIILAVLGLLWLVAATLVIPVLEVRAVLRRSPQILAEATASVEKLGGQAAAVRKIKLYLRLPEMVAPDHVYTLWILARCGRPGGQELFRVALGDDKRLVGTAYGILRCGWACPGADFLVAHMKNADPQTRMLAVGLLGDSQEAGDVLIAALSDEHPGVRLEAVRGLGIQPPVQARKPLEALLQDPDAEVRSAAAEALKRIKDAEATK